MSGITPVTKEPPWLAAALDQHVAKFNEVIGATGITDIGRSFDFVLMTLTEPPEGATPTAVQYWERSCDNCGAFTQPGFPFYTGVVVRDVSGVSINITFGVCFTCSAPFLEGELIEQT